MFSISLPRFEPHPLLLSGHLQTVVGNSVGREPPRHGLVQHRVALDDGDTLILHDDAPDAPPSHRIALLIHGLGGCHASGYVQRLSTKLLAHQIHPIRMDQRGCGLGEPFARHMAHAGRAADVAHCLRWLAEKFPGVPVTACGFSLGASVLLKALTNEACGESIDSAIAVSPPYDLADCCARIPWFYDRYYAKQLWQFWQSSRTRLRGADALKVSGPTRSILEFDRRITAPLNGYASVEAYYASASAGQDLHRLEVPTVVLLAEDDPIVPYDQFAQASLPSCLSLVQTRRGGHLGFVSRARGAGEHDRRWLEWRVVDWIRQLT